MISSLPLSPFRFSPLYTNFKFFLKKGTELKTTRKQSKTTSKKIKKKKNTQMKAHTKKWSPILSWSTTPRYEASPGAVDEPSVTLVEKTDSSSPNRDK